MKKHQLIDMVAEFGFTQKQAESAVGALVDAITVEPARGGQVQVTGFGSFRVSERAARTARNPQTGQPVGVAAHKAPVFKAGTALKQAVGA